MFAKLRAIAIGVVLMMLMVLAPPLTPTAEAQGSLPVLDIQLSPSDWSALQANACTCVGSVSYDGRVWNNVAMRRSGFTSINRAKGHFRLDFPAGDPFEAPFLDEPVDELTIDAGWPNLDLLREKLAWEMVADAGMESILSSHVRVSHNGSFHGLYLLREEQDGDWRNRHDLDNGPIYKFKGWNGGQHGFSGVSEKKEFLNEPDTAIVNFRSCLDNTGSALRSCMLDQADIAQLVNEFAAVALVQQEDQREFNFFLYRDYTENGLWRMQPDDLDRVLGIHVASNLDSVTANGAKSFRRCIGIDPTPANEICRAFMRSSEFQEMYNRRLRTLADEVLADPKWRADVASLAAMIEDDWQEDEARWNHTSIPFSTMIDELDRWYVDYLAHLRSGGHDGLVPAAQSAAPVVSATEYRPDTGDGLSYVLFTNSSGESVDMSNWVLGPIEVPAGLVVLPGATVAVTNDDAAFRAEKPGFDGIRGYIDASLSGDLTLQRRDGSTAAVINSPAPPVDPGLILNEWNAVSSTNVIANGDTYFGSVAGNGGDWFELAVVEDHLDVRGWTLELSDDESGIREVTDTFVFASDPLLADLRAGTIITISESLGDDVSFSPGDGDWTMNFQAESGDGGAFFTSGSQSNFDTNSNDWQLRILDSSGVTRFGPAGEGAGGLSGVGKTEVGELEADPSDAITPLSGYDDGDASTFGSANEFSGALQDFGPLRAWFTADSVAPTTDVVNPSVGEVIDSPSFDVTGTTTDDTSVSRVRVAVIDIASGDFLQTDGSFGSSRVFRNAPLANPDAAVTSWSLGLTLPNGAYRLLVKSIDAAGNEESTIRVKFEVDEASNDVEAPVSNIDGPIAGEVADGPAVAISGTTDDNVDVARVRVGIVDVASGNYLRPDGSFASGWAMIDATLGDPGAASTGWTLPANLADGTYRLLVKANDSAGNTETTQRLTFDVAVASTDVEPPSSELLNPTAGEVVAQGSVNLTGSSEDNVGVDRVRIAVIDVGSGQFLQADDSFGPARAWRDANLDSQGAVVTGWELSVALNPGTYRTLVKANDAAGNEEATVRVTFDVDSGGAADAVAPTSTISSGLDQPVGPTTLTGGAQDNVGVSQVRVWIRSRDDNSLWVQPDGSLSTTRTALTTTLASPDAANTNWSLNISLPAGRLRLIVEATDTSANTQDGATATNLLAG